MGPVAGIIPQPTVSVPPGTVPSCPTVSKYYHANVVYSGSTNGVSATFAPWNVPYVCDESQEHSLESVGMFLPRKGLTGSNDYLEIGDVPGLVTDDNGRQSHILRGDLFFFNYTDIYSAGTATLNVEGAAGTSAHVNQATLVASCGSCAPRAHYRTDSTDWPEVQLPSGDSPGFQVETNGEVAYDANDQMGSAFFQNPQILNSAWAPWPSYAMALADLPYCQHDYSSWYGPGSSLNYTPGTGQTCD